MLLALHTSHSALPLPRHASLRPSACGLSRPSRQPLTLLLLLLSLLLSLLFCSTGVEQRQSWQQVRALPCGRCACTWGGRHTNTADCRLKPTLTSCIRL